jgi:AcrR family transcriptional regulator
MMTGELGQRSGSAGQSLATGPRPGESPPPAAPSPDRDDLGSTALAETALSTLDHYQRARKPDEEDRHLVSNERIQRRRDPARRTRILDAAAKLVSRNGYHAVGMTEIGAEAGIVGSGIYRHFDSKAAILVSLLSQVMDDLQHTAAHLVASTNDDRRALSELVDNHVRIAIEDRRLLAVYHREAHNLPEEDFRRLRRAQRHYLEEWVSVVAPLRPDLSDGEARLVVHAAIGAVQSILFYNSGLPQERLADLLGEMAYGCLGVERAPRPTAESLPLATS